MIILVGPSASGKTEVAKYLNKAYGVKKVITHTSRPPRANETNGVDYFYVSKEEFDRLYEDGELLERASYNGNYYGCSKKEIGKDKCLIVEPKGLKVFSSLKDPSIVSFFLTCSKKIRKQRMILRGEKEESINSRLKVDEIAFSEKEVGATDFRIDTGELSVGEIGDKVYSLYMDRLKRV